MPKKMKGTGIEQFGEDEVDAAFDDVGGALDDWEGHLDEDEVPQDFDGGDGKDVFGIEADGFVMPEKFKAKHQKRMARVKAAEGADVDSEEEEIDAVEFEGRQNWGKDVDQFYGGSDLDSAGEDTEGSEDERLQEKEATFMQQQRMKRLKEANFGLDLLPEADSDDEAEEKTTKAGSDAELEAASEDSDDELLGSTKSKVDFSKMNDKEKKKAVKNQNKEFVPLMIDFKQKLEELKLSWLPLFQAIQSRSYKSENPSWKFTKQGEQYIEIKYRLITQYLQNLSFYLALKSDGETTTDHPVFEQLADLRGSMDALKTLDQKFEDKVIAAISALRDEAGLDDVDEEGNASGSEGDDESDGEGDGLAQMAEMFEKKQEMKKNFAVKVGAQQSKTKKMAEKMFMESMGGMDFASMMGGAGEDELGMDGLDGLDEENDDELGLDLDSMLTMPAVSSSKGAPTKKGKKRTKLDASREAQDLDEVDPSLGVRKVTKGVLSASLNQVEMDAFKKTNKAANQSADANPEFRERKAKKLRLEDIEQEEAERGNFGGFGDENAAEKNENEPDVKSGKQLRDERRAAKREENNRKRLPHAEVPLEGARKINRAIDKNRGLVRMRKREDRNGRVKKKKKFEKALKARKGQVQAMREGREDGGYDGEEHGMRAFVKKSVNIKV